MSNEDEKNTKLQKLLEGLKHLDLDLNWIIAVASLSAQEIAVKKKLSELGISPSEEDFQKLCEKLEESLKNQHLEPPTILLSVSRSYRKIRAELIHSIPRRPLDSSEVDAILNNTLSLIEVLFKKDIAKFIFEGLTVALFIDGINKNPLDHTLKTFSNLSVEAKRYIFDVLMEKVTFMKLEEIESNANIFVFINNVIKLENNLNLQAEFCEKLLKKTFYGVGLPCKYKLIYILVDITKLERIRNLIKNKNFVDIILTEFETSNSFNEAEINASIVLNLVDILSKEEVNRVVKAAILNNQITYSWGAQNLLKKFISLHKDKIPKEEIDKLYSLWQT